MQICSLSDECLDALNLRYGQHVEVNGPDFSTLCELRLHDLETDSLLLSSCAYRSDTLRDTGLEVVDHYTLQPVTKAKVSHVNVIVYVHDNYFLKKRNLELSNLSYNCKLLLQGKLVSAGLLFQFPKSKLATEVKVKAIEVISLSKDVQCCSVNSSTILTIEKVVQHKYFHQRNELCCKNLIHTSSLKQIPESLQDFSETGFTSLVPSMLVWGPSGSGKATLINKWAEDSGALLIDLDAAKLNSRSAEIESIFDFYLDQAYKTSKPCFLVLKRADLFLNQPSNHSAQNILNTLLNLNAKHFNNRLCLFFTTTNLSDVQLMFTETVFVGLPSCDERREYFMRFLNENLKSKGNNVDICEEWTSCTEGQNWRNLNKFTKSILIKKAEAEILGKTFNLAAEDFLLNSGIRKPKEVHVAHEEVSPVLGCSESKQKLVQTIHWPKTHKEALRRMSLEPDRAVLLYGEPGCGKTSLVRMLAHESKMTLFSISAADIYSPYLGSSEKQLNDIFAHATASAPSILFFDEIDCLAGNRKSMEESKVQDRVACSLFLCMDSIGCSDQNMQVSYENRVVVIATTNILYAIDPSLRRRFNKIIRVELPDENDRLEILQQYTSTLVLHPGVDLKKLARLTVKLSGADLECLCKRALHISLRASGGSPNTIVEEGHFQEALKEAKNLLAG